MSKPIIICPIGSIDEEILEYLSEYISNSVGIDCIVSPGIENPEYAFDKTRIQYNSKRILKNLLKSCPPDAMKLLGVTKLDLYVPILKYVFGLAQIDGQCSLISLHRLRPQFYNKPPSHDILLERTKKTALHELGHTLGLTHCRDRRCIMFSSSKIEDTDFKQPVFCPTCKELFRWYVEKTKQI